MIVRSITLLNNDVYFAIRLTGPTPEKLLDPNYFNLKIAQNSYKKISSGISVNSTAIEYEYWGNKFPHVEKLVYDRVGLATYLWPKNTDFFIRANFNSDNYEVIQITVLK